MAKDNKKEKKEKKDKKRKAGSGGKRLSRYADSLQGGKKNKKEKKTANGGGYDAVVEFRKSAPHKLEVKPYRNTRHLFGSALSSQVAHGEQVSNLAYEVGKQMGFGEETCTNLIIAGFFHDIGKTMLLPENGHINTMVVEEMNSIREHPMKSYEILKSHGFPDEVCNAVRWHHENKDGSGYPDHLKGAGIPVGACILRVCDVFCALVQDRPYRSAFTPEQAVHMMIEEVEKYDIEVFLAFQRVIHRGPNGEIQIPPVSPEVRKVWRML